MEKLTIGKVAITTDIPVATIRYYEREGLILPPRRNQSGYRVFDQAIVARLRFIVRAKALGFTLEEIRELLMLKVDAHATCTEIQEIATEKIALIKNKIRTLKEMENALAKMIAHCGDDLSVKECPFLTFLSRENHDD